MATNYRVNLSCTEPDKFQWYCSLTCAKEDGVIDEVYPTMIVPPDGEICGICEKDLYRDPVIAKAEGK